MTDSADAIALPRFGSLPTGRRGLSTLAFEHSFETSDSQTLRTPAPTPCRAGLQRGLRLDGFELVKHIGGGGMATLWLAKSKRGPVVLKFLPEESVHDEGLRTMFRDEAALALRLRDASIVRTYSAHEVGPFLFYAMEHLDGLDLSKLIARLSAQRLDLPLEVALYIALRLSRALAYAHHLRNDDGTPANIVHRDISPHNIFLTREGQVKLLDFGVAQSRGKTHRTNDGTVKGKIHYMAPEQVMLEPITHRADIFALGIVLWECAAQKRLFCDKRSDAVFSAINSCRIPEIPHAPGTLKQLLHDMLQRDPDRRPDSMSVVADRLSEMLVNQRASLDGSELALLVGQVAPQRPATRCD